MYTARTRTILLCAFAFVTSLVIWRAASGGSDNPAELQSIGEKDEVIVEHIHEHRARREHKHEKRHERHVIHIDSDELAAKIEAGLEEAARHLEEMDFEGLGEELEASLEEAARELERIEIEAEFGASTVHIKGRRDKGEVMIEETFSVNEGGTLKVNVPSADVEVLPGDADQAEVTVYLNGRDMDKAREYFNKLKFEVYSKGDMVVVETEKQRKRWNWNGWKRNGGARIHVEARIPKAFNTDLSTSGGDVTIITLNGQTKLSTSGGDVSLGTLTGPSIVARTSGGDIKAESVQSDADVELKTSGGDLTLGEISGAELIIKTSGGDINADHLDGSLIEVNTSGGDIDLDEVDGNLDAHTSGGDIDIETIDGDIKAGTSGGNIDVRLEHTSRVELKTSGGNIDIDAPSALEADLELKGGRVYVDKAFSFSGTLKKNRAMGEVNGGGPRIFASTSGGKITLDANQ